MPTNTRTDHWEIVPEPLIYRQDGTCVRLYPPKKAENENENYVHAPWPDYEEENEVGELYWDRGNAIRRRISWCPPPDELSIVHGFSKLPVELRRMIVSITFCFCIVLQMTIIHYPQSPTRTSSNPCSGRQLFQSRV